MNNNRHPWTSLLAHLPSLLLVVVLAVVVYVRLRLLAVPLERDEGEFAYIGQLLLKGIPPYLHAYSMKLPGTATVYALFMSLFGQTPSGIHLGLLFTNTASTALLFLLARRLFDRDTALVACSFHALLSISQTVYGVFAHATHFVVLFALAGLYLLLRYRDSARAALAACSGLCFGLAILMKQHAAIMALFPITYLAWQYTAPPPERNRTLLAGLLLFAAGIAIPYGILVCSLAWLGVFDNFWLWTISYAGIYSTDSTIQQGFTELFFQLSQISRPYLAIWLLAAAEAILMLWKRAEGGSDRPFIYGFLFFSFLSMTPRLAFREHYFIVLLPCISLLAAAAITSMAHRVSIVTKVRASRPVVIFLATTFLVLYGLYHEKNYLFIDSPERVSRTTYGPNPFPEARAIANFLKTRTNGNDRIVILGSEPEILFYADRLSATGHIYMYSLMENHPFAAQMQQQAIRQISDAKPKYIVQVNVSTSWLLQANSLRTILDWSAGFLQDYYFIAGVVDILGPDETIYLWGRTAADYLPRSEFNAFIFERKER